LAIVAADSWPKDVISENQQLLLKGVINAADILGLWTDRLFTGGTVTCNPQPLDLLPQVTNRQLTWAQATAMMQSNNANEFFTID